MIEIDYKSSRKQCQIITDSDTLGMIRNHFSVKNDGALFAKKKGMRFIKDRKYVITPTGLFDFGLYGEILKYLRDQQLTDITLTEQFKQKLQCGKEIEFWDGLQYDARYYQKDSVLAGLRRGYGIFLLATGAGKSLCQALLIENFKRNFKSDNFKCLLIVPGLSLVEQLQKDFKDYGVNFTFSGWTGVNPLQDTEVVICNTQNLNSKFLDNSWILNVDLLITDEAHGVNSDSNLAKIVNKIITPHKFGFTGTLSDKMIDKWKTIGVFGPVIYEKKSKELRDENYLTNVEVTVIQLKHRTPNVSRKYKQELDYLYGNQERNNFIYKLASRIGNNTLIMVNHLEHGDSLLSLMSERHDGRVFFVKGETLVEDRAKIIEMMEIHNDIICIAMSSIFSTGINIKNLPNIIFAGLGKSFIRVVQSIGRGLRLHERKNKLRIFDICDDTKYSLSHSQYRQDIYNKEQIYWKIKDIDI